MFVIAAALSVAFVKANVPSWAQHPVEWGFNQSRQFAIQNDAVPQPKSQPPRLLGKLFTLVQHLLSLSPLSRSRCVWLLREVGSLRAWLMNPRYNFHLIVERYLVCVSIGGLSVQKRMLQMRIWRV